MDVHDNDTIGTALGVHSISAWRPGQQAVVWVVVHDRFRPMGAAARCRYLLEHRRWSNEQDEGGIVPLDTESFRSRNEAALALIGAPPIPPPG